MRRFPVPALPAVGERVALDAAASHHLIHVCRHPRGARLLVFDGGGNEVEAVLVDVDGAAILSAVGAPRTARPAHALHLVLALPKGPALDSALRMAVETGVTHVHPAVSERSVPKGDRPERWARIVAAAAQQCGRADVPVVAHLGTLRDAAAAVPPDVDRRVALPGATRLPPASGPAAIAIGPEGGFSAREVSALVDAGWQPMGLGAWVLRVDTAVAVAVASTAPP